MDKLAIHGGPPALSDPVDIAALRPLRFGQEEKDALSRVVDSGVMCRTFGSEADTYESEGAQYFGARHAVASSSGTSSIHAALAAVGVGWGDEVITSPVTDMGSLIGIVAQGATPVFADIDPATFNMAPEKVELAITPRTKAILAVHLAGSCEGIEQLCDVAAKHGVAVVEDVAQSWLASSGGRLAGRFGAIGCFSTNGYKHISTGDGGLAVTNDPELARRMKLFTDKAYDRTSGVRNPSVFSMNYRITELQAAVGRVQLGKLAAIVSRRRAAAGKILSSLKDVPGLILPRPADIGEHSWWYVILRADRGMISTPTDQLSEALIAEGAPAWTGYGGGQPVYLYDCFQKPDASFYPVVPLAGGREPGEVFRRGLCPVAEKQLEEMIILSVSEHFTVDIVNGIIAAVKKVFLHFAAENGA